MRKITLKLVLVLLMTVAFFGCVATSTGISIWPSVASEKGKWNAREVSGYQKGEALMICVNYSSFGNKLATVQVKNAVTGKLVSENNNFVENYRVYFYTVHGLDSGSYMASVSTEGLIRATTLFNVD